MKEIKQVAVCLKVFNYIFFIIKSVLKYYFTNIIDYYCIIV